MSGAGKLAFPVRITPTGRVGSCTGSLPPPADVVAVGYPPNGPFVLQDPAGVWFGNIAHPLSSWRANISIGPMDPWTPVGAPLVYDAGTGKWKVSLSANGEPGFTCTLFFDVEWDPTCWCSDQTLRNYLDERLTPGGDVLSFAEDFVWLADCSKRRVKGGGLLWVTDHVRGLTYKVGSQAGPRALPQSTQFIFD